MNKNRRSLYFPELQNVTADIDHLLLGHHTVGNWSLGQICRHLTDSLKWTIDGFPVENHPWIVRKTFGAIVRRVILQTGRIPEGVKFASKYRPEKMLDPREQADLLNAAIRKFLSTSGGFAPHPMFDYLTRQEWIRYHCIHCAHHLSFAIPNRAN